MPHKKASACQCIRPHKSFAGATKYKKTAIRKTNMKMIFSILLK